LLWLYNVHNSTIEHCLLYDSGAANSAEYHANVCITAYSTHITWRYNEIYNWQVEGILWVFGGASDWQIYGNLWHDGMGGRLGNTHRILEVQDEAQGPIYFFNNTCVNLWGAVRTANGGTFSPGSMGRNNIYWLAGVPGLPDDDFDYLSGPTSEPNGINGTGQNPFMDYNKRDYRIVSGVGKRLPRNKGSAMLPAYQMDKVGNRRGADGLWDIGALEFDFGNGSEPNPILKVSTTSLDFGSVNPGQTATQVVNIENLGGRILAGAVIAAGPFEVLNGGAYSLASQQVQAIAVRYRPTTPATNQARLVLTGGGGAVIDLRGVAPANSQGGGSKPALDPAADPGGS
jgi:hypothetical protein